MKENKQKAQRYYRADPENKHEWKKTDGKLVEGNLTSCLRFENGRIKFSINCSK